MFVSIPFCVVEAVVQLSELSITVIGEANETAVAVLVNVTPPAIIRVPNVFYSIFYRLSGTNDYEEKLSRVPLRQIIFVGNLKNATAYNIFVKAVSVPGNVTRDSAVITVATAG